MLQYLKRKFQARSEGFYRELGGRITRILFGTAHLHFGYFKDPGMTMEEAQIAIMQPGLAWIAPTPGMRVADICSGYGESAMHIAATYGCHVTCVNVSREQNIAARKEVGRRGLEHLVEIVDADAYQLPFADGSFDAVWLGGAVLHLDDHPRVFAECMRVLKPGHRLALFDLCVQPAGERSGIPKPIVDAALKILQIPRPYTAQSYADGLKRAGFEVHEQLRLSDKIAPTFDVWLENARLHRAELHALVGRVGTVAIVQLSRFMRSLHRRNLFDYAIATATRPN